MAAHRRKVGGFKLGRSSMERLPFSFGGRGVIMARSPPNIKKLPKQLEKLPKKQKCAQNLGKCYQSKQYGHVVLRRKIMTVQNQNVKNVYRGNGSTTVFPFTFAINKAHPEYIHVYIKDDGSEDLVETRNFSYDMEAKTITYPKASSSAEKLSSTQRLIIYRYVPYKQNLNLVNQGPFFSEDVETEMDELEMQIQQLADSIDGGINPGGGGGEGGGDGGGGGCECDLKVVYFNTVGDLEGASVARGKLIETSGYYGVNDGGGASYESRYIPDSIKSAYPWAIALADSDENEYELVYKADGTPLTDENGEYVLAEDENGDPIPVLDDNGQPKKKPLYAIITNKVVNYRMFGAKLDGETDDEDALVNAHLYQKSVYTIEPESGRKRFTVSVENHEGIIMKGSSNPIICAGNIDLSGSQLIIQDSNATWFGFYLWGDNEEDYLTYEPTEATKQTYKKDNFVIGIKGNEGDLRQNSLLFLKEEPYAVRDDGGYLYSEPRYELVLHTTDGLLAQPFVEDWDKAGGEEVSAPFSDYETHQISTDTLVSHFTISYTRLPATHYYFKGCDVRLNTSANKYCSTLWCKCHNAHISGFNFFPDSAKMHNTQFKNTMIYIWACYNTEVSDIVGFNAAGKKENGDDATSGYVIRATGCLSLWLHDISVQGYWGATAMNCVKDIHIERVSINRLDIHNYFYNLFIDQCNLFNHSIQIGEGRGLVQITNSNFYVNGLAADSYPNAHILEFNLTYGRIFEGKVLIENCNAFLKSPNDNQFDVCKIDFAPEAVSTLPHYKFPEVTIRNCHFFSYDAETYLVYFMIAGTRKCKSSGKAPSNITNYCKDTGNDNTGNLFWQYIGRGVDWFDNGDSSRLSVSPGQIVRTYDKYLDSEGKTVFYNHRYFLVTAAGTLPTPTDSNKPSDTSGNTFTCGTATLRHVTNMHWQASKAYSVGDYCFTTTSSWLPVYCFKCVTAGTSNGYRPVHNSGTVIEGVDVYPSYLDACYWQHVGPLSDFIAAEFSPNMQVQEDQYIYADHKLYLVISGGTLRSTPPINTAWNGDFVEGTAQLSFVGKDWSPKTWWSEGCYCVSDVNGTPTVYKLVDQDGTTSGDVPVPGNACCVDGDMIWEYTTDNATKQWAAYTQFYAGDVVSANGNNYKCIFDGRLEMPHQIVLEDISTNMTVGGDVFAFWQGGTDVPTKVGSRGQWKIRITNVEHYRFRSFSSYFLHSGNPDPVIEISGGNDTATTTTNGLMSAADKTKLDGIATGAEVNQNAVSNVKVGDETISANAKTDTLELTAGDNITLTADTTNKKVTVATKRDGSVASGNTGLVSGGTVYDEVRPASDGTYVKTAQSTAANLAALDAKTHDIEEAVKKFYNVSPLLLMDGTADKYKKVFKDFVAKMSGPFTLTKVCDDWYTIVREKWHGWTDFLYTGVSDGTKGGDNANKVCVPSTNTVAGQDDYAGLPLFVPIDCIWEIDPDTKKKVIVAIDGVTEGFSRYDPAKFVGVLQQSAWVYQDEQTDYWRFGYSSEFIDGIRPVPLPEAVRLDGSVSPWVVHNKYPGAVVDGKWVSYSGVIPTAFTISHNSSHTIGAATGAGISGVAYCDIDFIRKMMMIKYASLTLDGIIQGCLSNNLTAKAAVTETGVKRILIASNGPAFEEGMSVLVGVVNSSNNVDRGSASCYSISTNKGCVITAVETVNVNGTDYKAIYVDVENTFNVTADTTCIASFHWRAGTCDNILGNDGSPASPGTGKYPGKIQGIEFGHGAYAAVSDALVKYVHENDTYYAELYFVRRVEHQSTSITVNYKATGVKLPQPATASWNYIKHMKLVDGVFVPAEFGASSSTYTKDAVYIKADTTGEYETLLFGNLSYGAAGGGASAENWRCGPGDAGWNVVGWPSPNCERGEWLAA